MNKNTVPKIGYFEETALVLRREGFQVEQTPTGPLKVSWNDEPLCEVGKLAGITYRNENVATPERMAAKDKAYAIVCTTAEYIEQMEFSAPVPVKDLEDRYTNNPNFRNGISPYIWDDYGKLEWYVYHPNDSDYQKFTDAVTDYLEVFQEQTQTTDQQWQQTM